MSSPSPWGGWGTKLKVTSIVSQGLEQVRNLREDVEKSFDQVVTGALVLPEPTIENDTRREMTQEMLEPSTEEDEKGAQQLEKESEEQVREEKQQDDEGTDEEQEQEEKAEGQVETNPVVESMERDENALEKFSTSEDDKKRVLVLEKELQVRESQLLTSSTTVRELHDELDKTCRREVVAVERAQYLTGQLEQMQREVVKLTQLHRKSSRSQNAEKMLEKVETSSRTRVQAEEILKRETQLRKDLEWHRQELQRLKSARSAPVSLENSSGEVWSEASILTSTLETTMVRDSFCSTSGNNTSILQLNQLQQRIRLREGENRMLKQQVEAMEGREKQLKDEIVRLSTRNTVLESNEAKREQMEGELTELKQHQVVLLELFGEKEEQVEELQAEVKELKAFYRKQLDALATHHEQ
ncbi:hypothetical protein PsorP6_003436 [Peronosclerospora sorghi]|uniref:Uncharacterized protein n=1 Tax=Peronosclerospora sorghi TaxID=230839 RepID=A0ACC0VP61_9STRA|nr:hypothetical protein PsorP6_003436 [Peronosclerospora sorghi]